MKKEKILQYALVFLGCLQSIGFMAGSKAVKGLALSTAASPLPIVFTQFRGIETYALDFTANIVLENDQKLSIPISPAVYGKVKGPYNLRNVYGAALSYGPAFQSEQEIKLRNSVLNYAFCKPATLAKDIGIQEAIKSYSVFIESRTRNDPRTWTLEGRCQL